MRHLAIESCLVACAGAIGGLLVGIGAASDRVDRGATAVSQCRSGLEDDRRGFWRGSPVGARRGTPAGLEDRTSGPRAGHTRWRRSRFSRASAVRLRHWLVAGQIAGSCVLLVFAGQMARGLQRLLASDQGFRFEDVVVLEPSLDTVGITGGTVPSYWQTARAIVGAHPETEQMTLVNFAPLGRGSSTSSYRTGPTFRVMDVDAAFFSTMRIPILAGRTFDPHEDWDAAVIISRRGALAMYGTLDVLGLGFPKGEQNRKIVGIAGDARLFSIQASDMAELYQPLLPQHAGAMLIQATAIRRVSSRRFALLHARRTRAWCPKCASCATTSSAPSRCPVSPARLQGSRGFSPSVSHAWASSASSRTAPACERRKWHSHGPRGERRIHRSHASTPHAVEWRPGHESRPRRRLARRRRLCRRAFLLTTPRLRSLYSRRIDNHHLRLDGLGGSRHSARFAAIPSAR